MKRETGLLLHTQGWKPVSERLTRKVNFFEQIWSVVERIETRSFVQNGVCVWNIKVLRSGILHSSCLHTRELNTDTPCGTVLSSFRCQTLNSISREIPEKSCFEFVPNRSKYECLAGVWVVFRLPCLGKGRKPTFGTKLAHRTNFENLNFGNLTFSKEGKIANFGTQQTQISDPGDLYWRSPSSSSSKLTRNDDSPKMMISSFRALRLLKTLKMMNHFFELGLYPSAGGPGGGRPKFGN